MPDLCGMVTGCYDICDSISELVWYAPPGYATYQWLYNNSILPWATSDTIHIPLYQSGVYTVKIGTSAGCSVISEPIDINFVTCGGCNFSGGMEIECGPVNSVGNQTYSLTFSINNSLGAGANLTINSSEGVVSAVTPSSLAAGINTVTATFEDVPAIDTLVCFTLNIGNQVQECDTTMCIRLPDCTSTTCQLSANITEFECVGNDAAGNPQYMVCMDVSWSGSNGSTFSISSSAGTFTVNPVTINNGSNSICYTYTDLPPLNTGLTIYMSAFDSANHTVCRDSVRHSYRPCPSDSCSFGVYGLCAHCHEQIQGSWSYDIELTIDNPFAGNANVSILPIPEGSFGPITPNPVGPGLQDITTEFIDFLPSNSIICFKLVLTEVATGKTCWKTVCVALPPCDSMTNILINTVENYTMMVYPNPANDHATINFMFENNVAQLEFVIRDVNGRELKTYSTENRSGEIHVNTDQYADGMYFIEIRKDGRAVGSSKFVVQKN
ncbi:MAG: T9SS type A sorting domain-containing protein [Bacteroidia bacterium]